MPILRMKEIREMSPKERETKIFEMKAELLRIKTISKAGGAIENPARIKEIRKCVARILTAKKEGEIRI